MAEAITQKVLVDNVRYCWLRCIYSVSGSTLSYELKFHWDGGDCQLDNCYIKYKNGSDIWRNSGRVYNYQGLDGRGAYDLSIKSGTATITTGQKIEFGIKKYTSSGGINLVGEFTVPVPPSGGSGVFNSSTWNTVNMTAKVSSWGSGYTGSPEMALCVCPTSATNSNWLSTARQVKWVSTTATSVTDGVTTANSSAYDGGLTIKGAMDFKIAGFGQTNLNGAWATTWTLNSTIYHTPPYTPASITYTQTKQSTNVKVNLTITGANSTYNYGNNVTTQYCYSTNGGSSYSSWTSISGTASPWTAKTASFTCPYGASVYVKARQVYNSLESGVKTINFTASSADAPSAGSVSIDSSTWNSVTLSASGINYGNPSGISSRSSIVGVSNTVSPYSYKREKGIGSGTSGTATVDNSSAAGGSAQPFDLKGMMPVYAYLWVNNTVQSAFVDNKTTPYYLPPAPGTSSYAEVDEGQYTIRYAGVASNNVTDYTASELKRTMRYKIDNGSWVYVDNNIQKALTAESSATITVPYRSTATVEAWNTYRGKSSDVTTFTITNDSKPVHFYGSVNNLSEEIEHLYGSVNGQSVKIVKLYGSAGGVSKEVFVDV